MVSNSRKIYKGYNGGDTMKVIKAIMMLSIALATVVYSVLMVKIYNDYSKEFCWESASKNDDSNKEKES